MAINKALENKFESDYSVWLFSSSISEFPQYS